MSAQEIHEWIRTGAAVIAMLAISFTAVQVWTARQQLRLSKEQFDVAVKGLLTQQSIWHSGHERSRKEKAIEIIRHFNQSFTPVSRATNKLVELLGEEELKKLDKGESFKITEDLRDDVQSALAEKKLNFRSGYIEITSEQSNLLKFQALEFLNAVEVACQALKHDVADQQIIKEELRFLYDPKEHSKTPGATLQKEYRKVFEGDKFYPAIAYFTAMIDAESAVPAPPAPTKIDRLFR